MHSSAKFPASFPTEHSRWTRAKYKSAVVMLQNSKAKTYLEKFLFDPEMSEAWSLVENEGWTSDEIQCVLHGTIQTLVNLQDPVSDSDIIESISYLNQIEDECCNLRSRLFEQTTLKPHILSLRKHLLDRPMFHSALSETLNHLAERSESKRIYFLDEMKRRKSNRSRKSFGQKALEVEFARQMYLQMMFYLKKPSYKFVGIVTGHIFDDSVDAETVRSWVKSMKKPATHSAEHSNKK